MSHICFVLFLLMPNLADAKQHHLYTLLFSSKPLHHQTTSTSRECSEGSSRPLCFSTKVYVTSYLNLGWEHELSFSDEQLVNTRPIWVLLQWRAQSQLVATRGWHSWAWLCWRFFPLSLSTVKHNSLFYKMLHKKVHIFCLLSSQSSSTRHTQPFRCGSVTGHAQNTSFRRHPGAMPEPSASI